MAFRLDDKQEKLVNNILKSGSENIRNFCIMAHVDHGKSTFADTLLTMGGLIGDKVDCAMDFHEDEARRGITINSASVSMVYDEAGKNYLINLIDSPGHVDFTSEVSKALRGVDSAILVVDASEGIKPQTITVSKQAIESGLTVGLFINKLDSLIAQVGIDKDKISARLDALVEKINELFFRLTGVEEYFNYETKKNITVGSGKGRWGYSRQSEEKTGLSLQYVLSTFKSVDGEKKMVEKTPLNRSVLMMVVDVFPNPRMNQMKKIRSLWNSYFSDKSGESRKVLQPYSYVKDCSVTDPFSGVVTFISSDKNLGTLVSVRVVSGTLRKGLVLYLNGTSQYKINKVSLVMGKTFMDTEQIPAGGLGLIQGIKEAKLGATVSEDVNFPLFDNIKYTQEPVITNSLKAKDSANDHVLGEALCTLVNQSGTMAYYFDEAAKEYVLAGIGPLQLQVEIDRIIKNTGVALHIGQQKLKYREFLQSDGETIVQRSKLGHTDLTVCVKAVDLVQVQKLKALTSVETYKLKNSGPQLEEMGYSKDFIKSIVSIIDGCIIRDLVKGRPYVQEIYEHLSEGVREACSRGTQMDAPLCGMQVNLVDADLHPDKVYRGPSEICPTMRHAIRKSILNSKKTILEPYNTFSVQADYMDNHIALAESELMKRRSKFSQTQYCDDSVILQGLIPMRELKTKDSEHVSAVLLGQSQGTTKMEMNLHGYLPCVDKVRDSIIAEWSAKFETKKEVKNNE